jgi:hypothetical protein
MGACLRRLRHRFSARLGQSPRYRIAPMSRIRDGVELYCAYGAPFVAPGASFRQVILIYSILYSYDQLIRIPEIIDSPVGLRLSDYQNPIINQYLLCRL